MKRKNSRTAEPDDAAVLRKPQANRAAASGARHAQRFELAWPMMRRSAGFDANEARR
jgi:hypothetical protein